MRTIENTIYDEERALYGSKGILLKKCSFDGPADGESALKESTDIELQNCYCNLRYPFWHNHGLKIKDTEMTQHCRAALWYSDNIDIYGTKLHGIKALRECSQINIENCDIMSPEFGWSVNGIRMQSCNAEGEYFMMRSENMDFSEVIFKGKYSFQYIKNSVFNNCIFDTKDAFWHSKNVMVKNCIIKGEYLAWYSDSLTLINCKISGTQPLCYCKNLKLVDCEMLNADLSFEKSEVEAIITSPVISIKNPTSGKIYIPEVCKIIKDDPEAKGEVIIKHNNVTCA